MTDTLLIKVPPQCNETDHWATQATAGSLLYKAGVRGAKWHHGSGSDQFFTAKFTEEQLTWLGLYGCVVTKNISKDSHTEVKKKINDILENLKFDKVEIKEVDIPFVFDECLRDYFCKHNIIS